jgi:hypothetical protein
MADDGAFAARQHRRHPSPFITEPPVPHRINPAMNTVEAGGMNTTVNCARRHPGRLQLSG